jgi:hypothetical protein
MFDVAKFNATNFQDRIKSVSVPRLKAFFAPDKNGKSPEIVWKVRGLTGLESARAKQAVDDSKNIETIIEAIGTKIKRDKIDAIKELAGVGEDNVPEDLVRRYSFLVQGSIEPECDQSMALKLAQNFPEEFYLITNTILQLTGQGRLGE